VLLLLLPLSAVAVDLPIDIEAIGQIGAEGGRREAVTARFGIDLFSPTADEVNIALENQIHERQDAVASELFRRLHAPQAVDVDEQVLRAAQASDLFAQPMQSNRAVTVETEETFSVWLIAIILLCSAVVGFLIAGAIGGRKERREHVSHTNA